MAIAPNATRSIADALILEGEDLESYIDEAVKKIMNYHPIDGYLGAEKIGNFLVMPHGERLYSLRRADSDAVIIVKADNPHQAASKARGIYLDRSEL